MIWESKGSCANDSKYLCNKIEYILCYAKSKKKCKINREKVNKFPRYTHKDKYFNERGKYQLLTLDTISFGYKPSMDYPIEIDGKVAIPGGTKEENKKHIWRWLWFQNKIEWGIKNGIVIIKKDKYGNNRAFIKSYQYCDYNGNYLERTKPYYNLIQNINSKVGTLELEQIFAEKKKFLFPKPVKLIKYLLEIFSQKDFLILDFFAGSGTTGHAVMEKNKEDGGERRFILITNNENQICETITYPRLKKVIEGIEYGNQNLLLCNYEENLKYFKIE